MTRNPLEIECLRAGCGQCGDQSALARACETADHDVGEALRVVREPRHDMAPVCAIAALELHRAPAYFVQHLRERAAALAATPAIHQWAPLAGPFRECALEHRSDVACNDRGAELARREWGIHIEGAHTRALGVVEHWMI